MQKNRCNKSGVNRITVKQRTRKNRHRHKGILINNGRKEYDYTLLKVIRREIKQARKQPTKQPTNQYEDQHTRLLNNQVTK